MELNCVSVSLGSSKRNKFVSLKISENLSINIYRFGVDGDILTAKKIIKELQNENIDAIGLGGIDLLLFIEDKYFVIRDAKMLYEQSKVKPVVDGSITKRILEPIIIQNIIQKGIIKENQKILFVSTLDRFESLKCFNNHQVMIGDLVFALKIDKILYNVNELKDLAKVLLEDVLNLPFNLIYPVGEEQEKKDNKTCDILRKYDFDVVIGDFHYINKITNLLKGKVVITNTLTEKDIDNLKAIGIKNVITTSIFVERRSFGANVMDCLFAAYCYKIKGIKISPFDNLNRELYLDFIYDFLRIDKVEGNIVI